MIFKPRDPLNPPRGRIDGLIYWGAPFMSVPMVPVGIDTSDTHLKYWDGNNWVEAILIVPDAALSVNVPLMTAGVLPAVDGSLLTNLPPSPAVVGDPGTAFGGTASLDGSGQLTLTAGLDMPNPTGGGVGVVVANGANASGVIQCQGNAFGVGGAVLVQSLLGGADSGAFINYVVAYRT